MNMPHDLPCIAAVDGLTKLATKDWSNTVEVVGPWGSGKALVAVQAAQAFGASLLYVTAGRIESEGAFEDLVTFTDPDHCVLLPAWDS